MISNCRWCRPSSLHIVRMAPSAAPPAGQAYGGRTKARWRPAACAAKAKRRLAHPAERVWAMLLDPATLQAVIPGCHHVEKISGTHFRAEVTLGIGPVKGRYRADVKLSDLDPPHARSRLAGRPRARWGSAAARDASRLSPTESGGTSIRYVYDAAIGGKVASIGGRLLDGAARVIIGQFFSSLARQAGGGAPGLSLMAKIRRLFGANR